MAPINDEKKLALLRRTMRLEKFIFEEHELAYGDEPAYSLHEEFVEYIQDLKAMFLIDGDLIDKAAFLEDMIPR